MQFDCLTGQGNCSFPAHNLPKYMKKVSLLFLAGILFFSLPLLAQIRIIKNGNVGVNTTQPAYRLDIYSMESRFFYSGRNALHINHHGMDPRLCSNDKIVFFKSNGSGFANIECQVLAQQADQSSFENIFSLENKGLQAIQGLKGVSFVAKNDLSRKKQSGFLAQDVETVIPEAVYTNDSTKIKTMAYSAIIPYLVEAIKEQQNQIEELKHAVTSLLENLEANILKEPKARLDQNIPNPFGSQTKIGCFIPEATNSSFLNNYDMKGTLLRQYSIPGRGIQELTIDGSEFMPGMYLYSLIIDGKKVDTRKMILNR